jgi:hypothetical protein
VNTKVLKATSARGGPVVLAAGATLAAVAIVGVLRGPSPVAAEPRPTVTVTATAPPIAGRAVRRSPSPSASPAPPARGGLVLAAAAPPAQARDGVTGRRAGSDSMGSGRRSGKADGGSAPTAHPSPTSQPPASQSSGVSVSLRRPLGLLPDVDLTIGGSK